MSLLIKALEKAARERQEKNAQEGTGTAMDGLALEPMLPAADDDAPGTAATSNDERRQAASAFVAASAPARGSFVVDYLRERPMLAFYIVAALFAIGYGTYVYLQISHPTLFIARAAPAAPPVHTTTAPHTATAAAPRARPADLQVAPRTPAMPTMPASGATGTGRATIMANAAATQTQPSAAAGETAAEVAGHAAGHRPPHRDAHAVNPSAGDAAQQAALEKPRRAFAEAQQRLQRAVTALTTDKAPPAANRNPIKVTPGGATPTVNPVLTQAYGAYASGDYRRALDLYRRVAQAEPLNTDALLGLAAAAAQTGNEKEAARSYGRALDIDPQNALAQAGLINLMGRSDPDAAEARLKLLLARKPSAFIYFALGNVYAGEGRWADAQEAYFHAYHRQPDNADYAYNVAVGLEHLGRSQRALHFYRRAVELAGHGGHVHFNIAAAQTQISRLAANTE